MLSPVIRKLLEVKLGKDIRYAYDVELLSYDIEKHTHQRISVNTLKRLLGLIEGVKEPRLYTLDTIACYLDFKNWDELISHLSDAGNSAFNSTEEIQPDSLNPGDLVSFSYAPDREVVIKYLSQKAFVVTQSKNSKLAENDIVEINHLICHYPLFIDKVVRNNENLGKFTAGKVSGITALELLR